MIPTYDVVFYGFLAVLLVPVFAVLGGLLWRFRLHRELAHVGRRIGARWWDAAAPVTLATGIITLAVLLGDVPDEGESGYLTFLFSADQASPRRAASGPKDGPAGWLLLCGTSAHRRNRVVCPD